ncbi:MAG: cupin domain-containing protein [Burkholderiaceae bacterium]
MAIHHASSGEVIDIRPLQRDLNTAITKALYKSDRLEVFRMILLAGDQMANHRVPGEITVQCLEGLVDFTFEETIRALHEGDLVCLAGGVEHRLKAVEDSSVLVTILLHGT